MLPKYLSKKCILASLARVFLLSWSLACDYLELAGRQRCFGVWLSVNAPQGCPEAPLLHWHGLHHAPWAGVAFCGCHQSYASTWNRGSDLGWILAGIKLANEENYLGNVRSFQQTSCWPLLRSHQESKLQHGRRRGNLSRLDNIFQRFKDS